MGRRPGCRAISFGGSGRLTLRYSGCTGSVVPYGADGGRTAEGVRFPERRICCTHSGQYYREAVCAVSLF